MVCVDQLMTIGAFARRTGLSISALRFYAGQGLLTPAEVDPASGYRRYAETQVADGTLIRDLRRLEMPLDDIASALEQDERGRRELVEHHLRRLDQVVRQAHAVAQTLGITNLNKETTMSTTLQSLDLAAALDQVLPAAGADPELPHLMGVLVEARDGSVRLVATDRYRLAIRDLVPTQLHRELSAVVPAASLSRWRSALGGSGELALNTDQGLLALTGDGIELSAPLVPVTFADYEQFLQPADDVTSVKVDRRRFLAALETVGAGLENITVLSTSAHELEISGEGQVVRVQASGHGPSRRVGLNPRFVVDAVSHAVGAEVIIEIEDPLSPVLFRSADDGTFTTRVMPIKLNE